METLETHNHNGPETFTESLTIQILKIWPELESIFDNVCLIYAGFHPEFSFFTRSSSGLINQILTEYDNGKRHFMFECLGEGLSEEVISKIHSCLDDFHSTHSDTTVYYLTGAYNVEELYKKVCKRLNLTPYIKIMECSYFEYINSASYPKFNIEYNIGERKKNFVCLNKVHRQHRIDLLELMLRYKLINDDCYYSFHDYSCSSNNILSSLSDEQYPNIANNLEFVQTLQLNFDDTRMNPVDIREEDLSLFLNSYFSIVTETLYYSDSYKFPKAKWHVSNVEPGVFITEKTTKVIALKHPFILASVPNTMTVLRERGYKTFHPYIDETYDTIVDDDLRLRYIINEVKRLSSQTKEEWIEWTRSIKPIVEHNYELFFNRTDYAY